jgi:hypothetical protein
LDWPAVHGADPLVERLERLPHSDLGAEPLDRRQRVLAVLAERQRRRKIGDPFVLQLFAHPPQLVVRLIEPFDRFAVPWEVAEVPTVAALSDERVHPGLPIGARRLPAGHVSSLGALVGPIATKPAAAVPFLLTPNEEDSL